MGLNLLLQTALTNGDDPSANYSYVAIDAEQLLQRRGQLAELLKTPHFYSVTFFDYTPVPLNIDDGALWLPNSRKHLELSTSWFDQAAEINALPKATCEVLDTYQAFEPSAATILYTVDGVMWCYYEKHCANLYETTTISWELLEEAIKAYEAA